MYANACEGKGLHSPYFFLILFILCVLVFCLHDNGGFLQAGVTDS